MGAFVDKETGEIIRPVVRGAFDYDADTVSRETSWRTSEPSKTDQSFAEEVDINTIVERFGLTGHLPENLVVPQEGDFTSVTDFQSALNVVRRAQEAFMEMPHEVRSEFNNDPGRFLDFVNNPANRARAEELGIVNPKAEVKAPEPVAVRVVADPAIPAAPAPAGTSST